MGFFDRLKRLIASNLNELISKAEDPEQMLDQILQEMRDQFEEAKKQVAVAIADEKRLKKQYEAELRKASEWEKRAMAAVKAGDDALAKKALMRKAEHGKTAQLYKEQWLSQKNAVAALKNALRGLNRKIEEAKRKRLILIAKKKRAEAQKSIQQTLARLTDAGALDSYARVEERIEQMAAEADASLELTMAMQEADSLAADMDALAEQEAADAMLAELKQKMGLEQPKARPSEPSEEEFDLEAELAKMKEKLEEPQ